VPRPTGADTRRRTGPRRAGSPTDPPPGGWHRRCLGASGTTATGATHSGAQACGRQRAGYHVVPPGRKDDRPDTSVLHALTAQRMCTCAVSAAAVAAVPSHSVPAPAGPSGTARQPARTGEIGARNAQGSGHPLPALGRHASVKRRSGKWVFPRAVRSRVARSADATARRPCYGEARSRRTQANAMLLDEANDAERGAHAAVGQSWRRTAGSGVLLAAGGRAG